VAEDDDDDDHAGDDQGDSVGRSASAQPDSPAETEDSSRPSSAMSGSQRGKKRKRPTALIVSQQQKGCDFWSMVEKWFAARMLPDQLGSSWTTPGWTKYVCSGVLHFNFYNFFITNIAW
jgi:hypothetical protein